MLSKEALDGSVLASSDQGNLGLPIFVGIIVASLILAALTYVCQKKNKKPKEPRLEDSEANGSLFAEALAAGTPDEEQKIEALAPEDM